MRSIKFLQTDGESEHTLQHDHRIGKPEARPIAETCDIPRDRIKPESHAINDRIDSLDFLDIAFAIDKSFGIKLPLEQWTQEVNDGKATTEQYFVLENLCTSIDGLAAAKA